MVYTMLKLDGKDTGALYQKGEMMKDVPTHWAAYISVANADEVAARNSTGKRVVSSGRGVIDRGVGRAVVQEAVDAGAVDIMPDIRLLQLRGSQAIGVQRLSGNFSGAIGVETRGERCRVGRGLKPMLPTAVCLRR